MNMTSKVYDTLKWVTMVALPAAGVLYTALASIWNLPYSNQVPATIMAITAFLGALLQISSANWRAENTKTEG